MTTPVPTTPRVPGDSRAAVVLVPVAALAEVVRLVVVAPIREGRLRTADWPPGLRAVAGLGLAAYVGAAALFLAGPTLRAHSDLTVTLGGALVFPRWTAWPFLVLATLALALLHAASLHLPRALRLGGLFIVVATVVNTSLTPWSASRTPTVTGWVGGAVIVALTLARWRSAFRWWEPVASLLVVGATLAFQLRAGGAAFQSYGLDVVPSALVLTMQAMVGLAVAFTFVAGAAFAQLALLLVHRVGDVVDERVRPTAVVGGVVGVVALGDVALVARHLSRPTASGFGHAAELGGSALVLGLGFGVPFLLVQRRRAPLELGGLERALSVVALPAGVLLTVTAVPNQVLTRLHSYALQLDGTRDPLHLDDLGGFFAKGWVIAAVRVIAAVLLLGWAARHRRRRPLPAVVAAATGVVVLVSQAGGVSGHRVHLPWETEAVYDLAALGWLLVLVGLLLTRRLDRRRLVTLGVALGLSLAFAVRSSFDAPFVALFGLGASAAIFLGLVWATCTDADDANGDSPAFPRPARVLLFVANALLAMTVLAFLSLARTSQIGLDIGPFATLGDDYLGTALLLSAYVVLAGELLAPRRVLVATESAPPHPVREESVTSPVPREEVQGH